nr:subtilisin-like protease SBT4.14 [Tanacetum cinerariifolium]
VAHLLCGNLKGVDSDEDLSDDAKEHKREKVPYDIFTSQDPSTIIARFEQIPKETSVIDQLYTQDYYIVFLGDQAAKQDSKANTHIGILSALKIPKETSVIDQLYTQNYYIVFLGDQAAKQDSKANTHFGILSALKVRILSLQERRQHTELDAKASHVYSYTKSINAFESKLADPEARELSGMDGVQSVILNQNRRLHTTRSWDFIGLPQTTSRKKFESDIIVSVMYIGITPQSDSLNDDGFGPPTAKWKGSCAKYFKLDGNPDPNDILSPVDTDGHWTHTSSTVAGISVASFHAMNKGILTVDLAGNDTSKRQNTKSNEDDYMDRPLGKGEQVDGNSKESSKSTEEESEDEDLLAEARFCSDVEVTEKEIKRMVMEALWAEYIANDKFIC